MRSLILSAIALASIASIVPAPASAQRVGYLGNRTFSRPIAPGRFAPAVQAPGYWMRSVRPYYQPGVVIYAPPPAVQVVQVCDRAWDAWHGEYVAVNCRLVTIANY